MIDEFTAARVSRETHIFQNVRPFHPAANAVCAGCGLALPHGPILAIGPGSLPPCFRPEPDHNG